MSIQPKFNVAFLFTSFEELEIGLGLAKPDEDDDEDFDF